jgi:hypothetical protein
VTLREAVLRVRLVELRAWLAVMRWARQRLRN